MKILFINKYDISGGAAIAAWRLHEQLVKVRNTDDRFVVGIKRSASEKVVSTRKPGLENKIEKGVNLVLNQLGLQYKWFPFSTRKIIKYAREFNPDIISLHNIHGGYFETALIKKLSEIAPIVWTLHDMWAFTANAAHTFGDESWRQMKPGKKERKLFPSIGLPLGKKLLKDKKKIYQQSNLTVVTPSKWLFSLASQSPLLKGKKVVQIYNGIDLNKFKLSDKAKAKKQLGLDPSLKVISFSAEKLMDSEHKGGKLLMEVLHLLDKAEQSICILTIGGGHIQHDFKHIQIREMGYITDEAQYIQCLQASDLYIHPTKADTLPNTLIEAIACGIPCITFDVGGCTEIIQNNENGFVIERGNASVFAKSIQYLSGDKDLYLEFSQNARKIAQKKFDVQTMAEQYFALFESLTQ
ncbi:MAG: glycosyltransferase [Chitinophagaceae bacterium]